jgi:hypothetical protein
MMISECFHPFFNVFRAMFVVGQNEQRRSTKRSISAAEVV